MLVLELDGSQKGGDTTESLLVALMVTVFDVAPTVVSLFSCDQGESGHVVFLVAQTVLTAVEDEATYRTAHELAELVRDLAWEMCGMYYGPRIPSIAWPVVIRGLSGIQRESQEEVVQDVCAAVLGYIRRQQIRKSFCGCVRGTAWRRCATFLRRKKMGRNKATFLGDYDQLVVDCSDSVEDSVVRQEELCTVRRILESLSPAHKSLLLLPYEEGLSYSEIAKKMGLPAGVVHGRLFRIREKVRRLLAEWKQPTTGTAQKPSTEGR
jgi:RNA polymerase sigma factor (sigma-70 family)